MDFSRIPDSRWYGKILRWPLRFLPKNQKVWILQGPLKGYRWIIGSGVHGYWLGSYEVEKCKYVEQVVKPGDIFYDIGAHVGYYTLLGSKLVGPIGKVIAFEPNPRNIRYLNNHLRLNDITNVEVYEAAVSGFVGTALFEEGPSSSEGRLSDHDGFLVKTINLDEFLSANPSLVPKVIKIDVEGAEREVLSGGYNLLRRYHPILFIATHSTDIQEDCLSFVDDIGYKIQQISPNEIISSYC
jgi:FkbM family methyltransferase